MGVVATSWLWGYWLCLTLGVHVDDSDQLSNVFISQKL